MAPTVHTFTHIQLLRPSIHFIMRLSVLQVTFVIANLEYMSIIRTYMYVTWYFCQAGFDTGFFTRGNISILGQDIGICIVCFGLLVVFVFWYFDILPNTY